MKTKLLNDDIFWKLFLVWIIVVVGFLAAAWMDYNLGNTALRQTFERDAIAHGAARYVANPETGEVDFKWATDAPNGTSK